LLQEVEAMETAGRRAREAFAALPKAPARFLGWPELAADVRSRTGRGADKPAAEQSAAWRRGIARATGLARVPPSYGAFLRWFPRPTEWKLVTRKQGWPRQIYVMQRQGWFARERALVRHLYPANAAGRRLIPFASNGGDRWLCWDPERIDAQGEPAIYAADYKENSDGRLRIERLGGNLLEVLNHYRPGEAPDLPPPLTPKGRRAGKPRYFEYRRGGSSKFWSVEVGEQSMTVRFGRIGTAGQERMKPFMLPADAIMAAAKLVREKLRDGYKEVRAAGGRGFFPGTSSSASGRPLRGR
jgi:predicted DNA-binding WGR domain protein